MCGSKPCKACNLKSKISGKMARAKTVRRSRSINVKNITKELTPVAALGVGYVSSAAVNKVDFIAANPKYVAGAKLLGGIALSIFSKDKLLSNFGKGIAASGAVDAMSIAGITQALTNGIGGPMRISGTGMRTLAKVGCPTDYQNARVV